MTTAQVDAARPSVTTAAAVASYWDARRAVWAVVAVGIALRAWVVASGYFYWDDYVFQGRAWRLPLDWSYLLYGHDGHLMPGAFLLQWPLTRLWPMNYLPLAVLLVVGQAVVVVLFARLALSLWGPRWAAVLPVTIVAITPLTLPTNTWWAAALNGIPLQIALVVALLAVTRWFRTRRLVPLWGAFAVWLVLLSFSEKLLVVPWAALAFAIVLDVSHRPSASLRSLLRRTWPVVVAYVVASGGYVALYLHSVGKQPNADASTSQVAQLFARGFGTSVAPGLFGGPLDWEPIGFGAAIGMPPTWLVVVSIELLLVLVATAVAVSPRGRRAWVWAGLYVLGDLALVAAGRLNVFVDPMVVQGLRYTADAAVPIAVAVGFTLRDAGPALSRGMTRLSWSPRTRQRVTRRSFGAVVGAVVVLSVISTAAYRDSWRANDSRAYIANATAELATAATGPALIDQPVPAYVLYGLSYPYNQASWLLAPITESPGFSDLTTSLRVLDDRGLLRWGVIEGPTARPGPVPVCGWSVAGPRTTVPLAANLYDFLFTVRIGYISGQSGQATVALGNGTPRTFPIERGLHDVVLMLEGGGPTMTFTDVTPGVTMCTDEIAIGAPKAVTP